MNIHTN